MPLEVVPESLRAHYLVYRDVTPVAASLAGTSFTHPYSATSPVAPVPALPGVFQGRSSSVCGGHMYQFSEYVQCGEPRGATGRWHRKAHNPTELERFSEVAL